MADDALEDPCGARWPSSSRLTNAIRTWRRCSNIMTLCWRSCARLLSEQVAINQRLETLMRDVFRQRHNGREG